MSEPIKIVLNYDEMATAIALYLKHKNPQYKGFNIRIGFDDPKGKAIPFCEAYPMDESIPGNSPQ